MKETNRRFQSTRRHWPAWWPLLAWICLPTAAATAAQPIGEPLEQRLMAHLAEVQQQPASHLVPFTTDGCSGGMSAGWEHMAQLFPRLGTTVGKQPPWEACCVAHDRAYWQGRGGYQARLAADRALRRCVVASAAHHAPALAARLKVPTGAVADAFVGAADLMYAAVRVGGVPCSTLSWRWGYGWPQCAPLERPAVP